MIKGMLVLWLSTAIVNSQAFSQVTSAQGKQIDSLFSNWNKPNSPGMEVIILHKGKVIWDRPYGLANLEKQIPNSSNRKIWVASVSKQFTALSVLLLVADQKINLEDDIRKYLPELPFFGDTIRVKNLLYHTSGLRDGFTLTAMSYKDESQYSSENVIKYLSMQKGRNFKPGERFEYNNGGYVLLAQIIERVSKMSLTDYTRQKIFKPLGMDQSRFVKGFPTDDSSIALGYSVTNAAGTLKFEPAHFQGSSYGSTGLLTTAEDLAKYDLIFYEPVFGKKVQQLQLQRGKLNNGDYIPYGAGLEIEAFGGKLAITHSGSDAGYKAEIVRFPGDRFTVICLANREDVYSLTDKLFRIAALFIKLQKKPTSAGKSACIVKEGTYINKTNLAAMRFVRRAGKVQLAANKDGWYQTLLNNGTCDFGVEGIETDHYIFKQTVIHFATRADKATFHLIKAVSHSVNDVKILAGKYYSDELKVTYNFFEKEGLLHLKFFDAYDIPLTAYEGDLFSCDFIGTNIIHFARDNNGNINGMEFNRDGIYKLSFSRL